MQSHEREGDCVSNTISFTTEQVAAQQRVIKAATDLCSFFNADRCVDLDLLRALCGALILLKEASK